MPKELSMLKATKFAYDIETFIANSPQWSGGTLYRGIAVNKKNS